MSKKLVLKQEAPKKEEPTAFEDFFTQFIDKRKKYWINKLDEIAKLEGAADLKPDQIEKVKNKDQTLEKLRYFDDIKKMYFEAAAKKNVQSSGNEQIKIDDLVEALAAGKLLTTGRIAVMEEDKETATDLAEVYNLVSGSNFVQERANTKKKLSDVIQKKNFSKTVKGVYDVYATLPEQVVVHSLVKIQVHQPHPHTHSHVHDSHAPHESTHHHEHERKAPRKNSHNEQPKKPLLFHHSSSEDENEYEQKDVQKHHQKGGKRSRKESHKEDQFGLVPLPETEKPIEEEFVKLDSHRGHRNGRKSHGRFGGRPPRDDNRQPREDRPQHEGEREHHREARPEHHRGGYKGKHFDPNYKRNRPHKDERHGEHNHNKPDEAKPAAKEEVKKPMPNIADIKS